MKTCLQLGDFLQNHASQWSLKGPPLKIEVQNYIYQTNEVGILPWANIGLLSWLIVFDGVLVYNIHNCIPKNEIVLEY